VLCAFRDSDVIVAYWIQTIIHTLCSLTLVIFWTPLPHWASHQNSHPVDGIPRYTTTLRGIGTRAENNQSGQLCPGTSSLFRDLRELRHYNDRTISKVLIILVFVLFVTNLSTSQKTCKTPANLPPLTRQLLVTIRCAARIALREGIFRRSSVLRSVPYCCHGQMGQNNGQRDG